MPKNNENLYFNGKILESLPNTMFKIELENGNKILCTLAGKIRRGFVRLLPGDIVKVEMTPYDKERGRIVGKI